MIQPCLEIGCESYERFEGESFARSKRLALFIQVLCHSVSVCVCLEAEGIPLETIIDKPLKSDKIAYKKRWVMTFVG